MKVREHFLLATEHSTISATAKQDMERQELFHHAIESILIRYQEEFGSEACAKLIHRFGEIKLDEANWRIRPEDSCWNQVSES